LLHINNELKIYIMGTENKPENPNAFPSKEIDFNASFVNERTIYNNEHTGMTLLDYNVSKLMQVYLSNHLKMLHTGGVGFTVSDMVDSSYLIAKEILKQREL